MLGGLIRGDSSEARDRKEDGEGVEREEAEVGGESD